MKPGATLEWIFDDVEAKQRSTKTAESSSTGAASALSNQSSGKQTRPVEE
jgi:hypothetical protein